MKIVVSTIGQFHSFNLAYELQQAGHLHTIFTSLPRFRVRNLRVDAERIRTIPWIVTPQKALLRWFRGFDGTALAREVDWYARLLHDRTVARQLPDCDLVSALTGCSLETGRTARRRGIRYVCDRGASHIVVQDRILREEYERLGMPYRLGPDPRVVDLELEEYEIADQIMIPSTFVWRGFREMGVPDDKLRVVPLGVDLRDFKPCAPRAKEFRILFAGMLSVQKGIHYLLQAFRIAKLPNAKLVFVGLAPAESEVLFKRYAVAGVERPGSLSWPALAQEMSRSSVLVLPSVQDGMGQVLGQAMACGCPVIASRNTGAADLFTDGVEGFVVPIRDPEAIAERLTRLYRDRELLDQMAAAALARVKAIGGWSTYGRLSLELYSTLVQGRPSSPPPKLRPAAALDTP